MTMYRAPTLLPCRVSIEFFQQQNPNLVNAPNFSRTVKTSLYYVRWGKIGSHCKARVLLKILQCIESLVSLVLKVVTSGFMVAQLRVIFSPDNLYSGHTFFAYIQPFKLAPTAKGTTDPGIHMYRVVRDFRRNMTRKGLIVPLSHIWRPVELIPRFGSKCNVDWTCDTAVEYAREFYLNCFADKPSYIEVYQDGKYNTFYCMLGSCDQCE